MSDPRLTIEKLTGSKGGLIIDESFSHLASFCSQTKNYTYLVLEKLDETSMIKPNQEYGFHYHIRADHNPYNFSGYMQILKYTPAASMAGIFTTLNGQLISTVSPSDNSKGFIVTHSSDLALQHKDNTEDSAIGWSYISFGEFTNDTGSVLDRTSASQIKKFHSSIKINKFTGSKKIFITENSGTYCLLKLNTFYYIKMKPWGSHTNVAENRNFEMIVNVTDMASGASVMIGPSSANSNEGNMQIYYYSSTQARLWLPYTSDASNFEVYELPFAINKMNFAGMMQTQDDEISTSPSVSASEVSWSFTKLLDDSIKPDSVDVDFKAKNVTIESPYERTRTYTINAKDLKPGFSYTGECTLWSSDGTGLPWPGGTEEFTYTVIWSGNQIKIQSETLPSKYSQGITNNSCTLHSRKIITPDYYKKQQ